MKLLLLLLSVMTFTVQTKNSVSAEGSFPYDMEVDYACNYQKGTVRNGDTATLTLSNLGNLGLESVQIYLRSNTSSGAGKLTITADNTSLMGKTGTYQSWFGAYDNTNYHPIGWTGNYRLENGRLQIRLVGTTNSLYIEKYEIQYTLNQPAARTVSLYSEGRLIETLEEPYGGQGIQLPRCEDREGWAFYGWATNDIATQTTSAPVSIYRAGQWLFPQQDMTLYAVWTSSQMIAEKPLGELASGYYIIEHQQYDRRLTGPVSGGYVSLVKSDANVTENDVYYLEFSVEDSTCTIRNYTYKNYIGFTQSALSTTKQSWNCSLLKDSTFLFYCHRYNQKMDVLFPDFRDEEMLATRAHLRGVKYDPQLTSQWALYAVPDPAAPIYYYSYPSLTPVVLPQAEPNTFIIPIGIYELHIQNGKKTIYLRK